MAKKMGMKKSATMSANISNESIEMHIIVQGRVQGVGFRYTTVQHAKELGILGIVRNLPNGNVEIYALGYRVAIERLILALRQDFNTYISNITVTEISPARKYENFSIGA